MMKLKEEFKDKIKGHAEADFEIIAKEANHKETKEHRVQVRCACHGKDMWTLKHFFE